MNNSIINQSTIFSLISIFFITACGGGSSSSSSETETKTYSFELTASLTNQCGVKSPFTDIELLIQDDDWQVTERYSADSNGQISFTSTDEFINYTLVAQSQSGDDTAGLDINSFYQAETASSNTYTATYDALIDNETCQCITSDLLLTHRSLTARGDYHSSLTYESVEAIDSNTTQFNNVEVCRETTANWPIASFMVTGESSSANLIGAANFLTTFTEGEVWSLSAIEIPEDITLITNELVAFTSSQIIDANEHFLINISAGDGELLVFNSHQYLSDAYYKFYTEQQLADTSTLFSESYFVSANKILSTSYDEAYNTEVSLVELADIDVDYTNFSELSADGSYDYSAIKNHPMSIIKLTYNVLDTTGNYYPVTWTNYGEDNGMLASSVALTDYPDFINEASTMLDGTEVILLQSDKANSYQDYINFFQQGNSLTSDENVADEFNAHLHYYQISYTQR